MKYLLALVVIFPVSLLTSCGALTPSDDGILLYPPDSALTDPCSRPLPLEGLETQAEQASAWRRDRIALVTCFERHQALTSWSGNVVDVFGPQ